MAGVPPAGVPEPGPDGQPPASRVRVRIAGDEYVLRGTLAAPRLSELAAQLDRHLAELRQRYPRLPLHQAAVLCALQLLEELERLRQEHRELLDLLVRPRQRREGR